MGTVKTLRSVIRVAAPEFDLGKRRLRHAATISDLREIARRRLPTGVFDYIDGGAEEELSLRRNVEAFRRLEFQPRILAGTGDVDPSATLLGRQLPLPLILAPTGFTRIATPGGELDVARAAERAGIPYVLSTLSTRSIEEVAAVSRGPKWFQVYVWRDRGLVKDMLARAATQGYEAVVLTADTPVLGHRERDVRRGFTLPPQIGWDTIIDGARHPTWTWSFVRSEPITFANVVGSAAPDGTRAVDLAAYVSSQFDASLSWRDLDWLRSAWRGPLVLKGVQTVEDARIASDCGLEAVALSNHGGRQLDGSPPPLELVRPVVDAVGDRVEVICDGGIRSGADIVKAVALGARACMAGRAYLYGLGAAGEQGVDYVYSLLESGVRRTLALAGCGSLSELEPRFVRWRNT